MKPFAHDLAPSPNFSETTRLATELAAAAGEVHMRHWRSGLTTVELKNPQDIVTQADHEAEALIVARLQRECPDDAVLGEETGRSGNPSARRVWIVDPLDGTSNFANGDSDFAALIACEEDGQLVSGVIHFPATGETFTAERGLGAFKNGRLLRGVRRQNDVGSMYGNTHMSSKQDARARNMAIYTRLMDITQEPHVRNMLVLNACIARGLSDVADGISDFHVRVSVNWWDYAAGKLLIEEAGGVSSDLVGLPLTAESHGALLAGPQAHHALLDLLHTV